MRSGHGPQIIAGETVVKMLGNRCAAAVLFRGANNSVRAIARAVVRRLPKLCGDLLRFSLVYMALSFGVQADVVNESPYPWCPANQHPLDFVIPVDGETIYESCHQGQRFKTAEAVAGCFLTFQTSFGTCPGNGKYTIDWVPKGFKILGGPSSWVMRAVYARNRTDYLMWNQCAATPGGSPGDWEDFQIPFQPTCTTISYYIDPQFNGPELGCPAKEKAAGNPVNAANGCKFQKEEDYVSAAVPALGFKRYYNSQSTQPPGDFGEKWSHSFSGHLVVYPNPETGISLATGGAAQSLFPTEQSACEDGWEEQKAGVVTALWKGSNTVAHYESSSCNIYSNGMLVDSIVVFQNSGGQLPAPQKTYRHLARADGRIIRFEKSLGTAWIADSDAGFTMVDGPGPGQISVRNERAETEVYSLSTGKLLSWTLRGGEQLLPAYDANGSIESVTSSLNYKLKFAVSGSRIQSIAMESGGTSAPVASYAYQSDGLLEKVTFAEGTARNYNYDDPDFPKGLTAIVDENGAQYASWNYDSDGRAISSTHSSGANSVLITSVNALQTDVTDAFGVLYRYHFKLVKGASRVMSVDRIACSGCPTEHEVITRDSAGYPDKVTDYNGHVTDTDYADGQITRETRGYGSPLAQTTTTQSDPNWRQPTLIVEGLTPNNSTGSRKTTNVYDSVTGNLKTQAVEDLATSQQRLTTFSYCEAVNLSVGCPRIGLLKSVDGPRVDVPDITSYTYTAQGNISTVTNALGQVTTYSSYDGNGRLLSMTDPNGVVTTLTWWPRGWLKTSTTAGKTTTYDYDGVGQLTKVTQPTGYYIQYTYDAAHRLTDLQDPAGNRIHYTLDAMGNRTKEETFDPGNTLRRTSEQVYNELGRLKQDKGPYDQLLEYTYDAEGNRTKTQRILPSGTIYTHNYTFDALDRLKTQTEQGGFLTQYGYDALDRPQTVTDPRSLTTTSTYNAFGDVVTLQSPDTGLTSYTYDEAGNLNAKTDARGITTTYTYDALNRLLSADAPGTASDITYAYDGNGFSSAPANAIGRLGRMITAQGSWSFYYNPRGAIVRADHSTLGAALIARYGYDNDNRLIQITYPSGRLVNYTYDSAGNIGSVTTTAGGVTTTLASGLTYRPFGPMTGATLGNGLTWSVNYDLSYRYKSVVVPGILNLSYGYDARDLIKNVTDNLAVTNNQVYTYTSLGRLSQATGPYGVLAYTYDSVGNRKTEVRNGVTDTYIYPATSHRLESISGGRSESFGYDAAGNLTSRNLISYVYDDAGRLEAVSDNGTTLNSDNFYSPTGQRQRKTTGGQTTRFYYDTSGNLLEERIGSTIVREYIWLNGQPLAVVTNRAGSSTQELFYLHTDNLGTPKKATDQSQLVVWEAQYEPYGKTTLTTNLIDLPFRFPGQYLDTETGLHQNWHRDYEPTIGRYVQSDPIGLDGGISTFAYAGGNPISSSDPTGQFVPAIVAGCATNPAACGAIVIGAGMVIDAISQSVDIGPWPDSTTRENPWTAGAEAADEIEAEGGVCDPNDPDGCKKRARQCTQKCVDKSLEGHGRNTFEWIARCKQSCTSKLGCGNYFP